MKFYINLQKIFIIFLILPFPLNAQFKYRKVDSSIVSKIDKKSDYKTIKNKYFTNAKDLTCYLPVNFSKKGDVDYTNFLQNGIDLNSTIILPDFPILINFSGLKLKSNSSVLFQKNLKLILKPNSEELYGLLYIENVENVKVYFANLIGDREYHIGDKGEWGMGIFIRSSKNIKIYNPTISSMWGDGIYIGNLNGPSENIEINSAIIDKSRRNGISIISGIKIEVKNSVMSNTYGAIPEYGIDIEPNNADEVLKDIILSNNITYNNFKGGVLFALDNLQGGDSEEINIAVSNHIDYYSEKGIEFHIDRGYQKYTNPIKGIISINGASLFNNKSAVVNNESKPAQIKLNLVNIKNNNILLNDRILNNFVEKFKKGKLEKVQ